MPMLVGVIHTIISTCSMVANGLNAELRYEYGVGSQVDCQLTLPVCEESSEKPTAPMGPAGASGFGVI